MTHHRQGRRRWCSQVKTSQVKTTHDFKPHLRKNEHSNELRERKHSIIKWRLECSNRFTNPLPTSKVQWLITWCVRPKETTHIQLLIMCDHWFAGLKYGLFKGGMSPFSAVMTTFKVYVWKYGVARCVAPTHSVCQSLETFSEEVRKLFTLCCRILL